VPRVSLLSGSFRRQSPIIAVVRGGDSLVPTSLSSTATPPSTASTSTLPELYPEFASVLSSQGYVAPTPIQRSSAEQVTDGGNVLLIAPTGSGKTLAYLLPALTRVRALEESERAAGDSEARKTALVVAPTRELAAQLARDATLLLHGEDGDDDVDFPSVLLAVRGIPPPSPDQIARATVLVGTPNELRLVLTRVVGGREFVDGKHLAALVLDEVDALLPPPPKTLRTGLDKNGKDKVDRKKAEQKRKMKAAMRQGLEFRGDTGAEITLAPTERILRLAAAGRGIVADGDTVPSPPQVLAGSATASRRTRDRLNGALRSAAAEVWSGASAGDIWGGNMEVCRPDNGEGGGNEEVVDDRLTIRGVTVPSAVSHRYVSLTSDSASDVDTVLNAVAAVAQSLRPESSLLFICGEFGQTVLKEKKKEAPKQNQKTSKARRDADRKRDFEQKRREWNKVGGKKAGKAGPQPLSVRKACTELQKAGIDARPMHVVLGLEPNAEEEQKEEDDVTELPPVLVTFEGSARGLHFDGVDVVFVVGRPSSAASYLHLAGRVGRATTESIGGEGDGDVAIRPGTIVSFCSKGRTTELEKWTNQVGGTALEEIVLSEEA